MRKKTIFVRKQPPSFLILLSMLVLTPLLLLGCKQSQEVRKVSLEQSERIKTAQISHNKKESLSIAVSAMISPRETVHFYKELLTFLSEKIGLPIELVQRETYAEVNTLLQNNRLDAAFVCSGAYIQGHDSFGLELLVAPVVYGKAVYYSYIIVPQDSPAQTLADLRGKTFTFTDPLSNTGKLSPLSLLTKMGETPEHFFSHTSYSYSHDNSIEAVAKKQVDGAAVDSLVWEYLQRTDPLLTSKTRIIAISPPYAIPPVVVPRNLDSYLKEQLRTIFVHMHEDPNGRAILQKIMIERFTEISDGAYDTVRYMHQRTDNEE